MLRSTMWVASGLALVRCALVFVVGWCFCQAIPAYRAEPEFGADTARWLGQQVGAMLALLSPIVIGAFLTYAAYAALRGRAHALPMLRVGYAAGLLDALVWGAVGLYYAFDTAGTNRDDPSMGICVMSAFGAAGIRALMSAVTVSFYVTAWLTVEQPEHKTWLSGAQR